MTQLQRVTDFIKERGSVFTHELEAFALESAYGEKLLGGSATRYARLLLHEGKVEHPKDENGKANKHIYKWVGKVPEQKSLFFS